MVQVAPFMLPNTSPDPAKASVAFRSGETELMAMSLADCKQPPELTMSLGEFIAELVVFGPYLRDAGGPVQGAGEATPCSPECRDVVRWCSFDCARNGVALCE
jgi:hypothetical protein